MKKQILFSTLLIGAAMLSFSGTAQAATTDSDSVSVTASVAKDVAITAPVAVTGAKIAVSTDPTQGGYLTDKDGNQIILPFKVTANTSYSVAISNADHKLVLTSPSGGSVEYDLNLDSTYGPNPVVDAVHNVAVTEAPLNSSYNYTEDKAADDYTGTVQVTVTAN